MHFGEYELSPSLISLSPYPQVIQNFFQRELVRPPLEIIRTSACPWVDHSVSRLSLLADRPIQTRFRFASVPEAL